MNRSRTFDIFKSSTKQRPLHYTAVGWEAINWRRISMFYLMPRQSRFKHSKRKLFLISSLVIMIFDGNVRDKW